jgi:hypothetical protein
MSVPPPPKEKPMSKRIKKMLAATVPAFLLLTIAGYPKTAKAQGDVRLKAFPTEPITSFTLHATNRRVFETLGRLADLKVTFSDDFKLMPISIDMSNVKIEDVLNAASLKAQVFWVPVASDTILIVPDSPANRKKYGNGTPKPK